MSNWVGVSMNVTLRSQTLIYAKKKMLDYNLIIIRFIIFALKINFPERIPFLVDQCGLVANHTRVQRTKLDSRFTTTRSTNAEQTFTGYSGQRIRTH